MALALHCDVTGDATAAVRLYKAAATRGHPVAQAVLGCGYYWGRRGLARDAEDAMVWLGRSAKQLTPIVHAWSNVHDGQHDEAPVSWSPAYSQDVTPTVALLRRVEPVVPWTASAALPGTPQQRWRVLELANWLAVVALLLGLLHLDGEGSRVDVPEALRWLKQAAQLGSAEAERVLGSLYNTGQFG